MKVVNRIIGFLLLVYSMLATAESAPIKDFSTGTYQRILASHAGNVFMLVFWSMDCTTCIKDLELISGLHKARPDLKIVMVSVDEPGLKGDIQSLLEYYQLADVENWLFDGNDSQTLFGEIDPNWNKELPRTYFFSETQHRESHSGELTRYDQTIHFEKHQAPSRTFGMHIPG